MSASEHPLQSSANKAQNQQVHFLFTETPPKQFDELTKLLTERFGEVKLGEGEISDLKVYYFPEYRLPYKEGELPAQGHLLTPENSQPDLGRFETARQQSWHWPGAFSTVKAAQKEWFLTDMFATGLKTVRRMALLNGFLRSAIEVLRPDALYFTHSDRLEDPIEYLKTDPSHEALHGFVNVRLFRIGDGDDKQILMDTLGMHALGLPDLEIYFQSYAPQDVAQKLYDYAYYLFEEGNVIGDGNDIEGLNYQQLWKAILTTSSVGPDREVIRFQNDDYKISIGSKN